MAKVTVYRFKKYDIESDHEKKSRRWGTREAIEAIDGAVLEDTATEVDEAVLGREINGLSDIGYDPHATKGFQTEIRG